MAFFPWNIHSQYNFSGFFGLTIFFHIVVFFCVKLSAEIPNESNNLSVWHERRVALAWPILSCKRKQAANEWSLVIWFGFWFMVEIRRIDWHSIGGKCVVPFSDVRFSAVMPRDRIHFGWHFAMVL